MLFTFLRNCIFSNECFSTNLQPFYNFIFLKNYFPKKKKKKKKDCLVYLLSSFLNKQKPSLNLTGRRMKGGGWCQAVLGFQLEFLRNLCQTSAWGDKRLIKNLVKQGKNLRPTRVFLSLNLLLGWGQLVVCEFFFVTIGSSLQV